ncbi:MAG: hypothetical protein HFI75_00500 [Lachnospiraceae bacterium]|nr:hypothetical protein [Lachnospiraceae bacterium]
MIGKTILDSIGLSNIAKVKDNKKNENEITFQFNAKEFDKFKTKIDSIKNDPILLDIHLKEKKYDQIDGLKDYIQNTKKISKTSINKILDDDSYAKKTKNAKGYQGVKSAIETYNAGILDNSLDTDKFLKAMEQTNPALAKAMTQFKNGKMTLGNYAASLAHTTAKTLALEAGSMALNAAVSMGISVLTSVITGGIQYLLEADDRYLESQQNIIDKANENITRYDEEINSLESLQSKLAATAGDKAELAKISGELNSAIGSTPGLLEGEGNAYDIANKKLRDRIALLKQEKEEAVKDKVNAANEIYKNQEVNNSFGVDVDIRTFRKYQDVYEVYKKIADGSMKKVQLESTVNGNKTVIQMEEDNRKKLEQAYGKEVGSKLYIPGRSKPLSIKKGATENEIWAAVFEDTEEFTFGTPNVTEINEYFNKQLNTVNDIFNEYLSKQKDGMLAQIDSTSFLTDLVYAAYTPKEIQKVFQSLSEDSNLEAAVADFYQSIRQEDANASSIYTNLEHAFQNAYKEHPESKEVLEELFYRMTSDIDEMISGTAASIPLPDVLFSADFTPYRKELTELEKAGRLDASVLQSNEHYKRLLTETGLTADQALSSIRKYVSELSSWSDGIDSIQGAYSSVSAAITEYNENGSFSLDTLQKLLSLDDSYLSMLIDENGNLTLNEEAYKSLALARLDEAEAEAVQSAMRDLESITSEAAAVKYLEENNYNLANSAYTAAGAYAEFSTQLASLRSQQGLDDSSKQAIDSIESTLNAKMSIINNSRKSVKSGNAFEASNNAQKKEESLPDKEETAPQISKSEKQIDFFEYRLTELDHAISTVESHMNNFTGSAAKNLAIDSLIKINTDKQSDLQKSLSLYTHMAEEELAKIPAQFQQMAQNGAVNITDFIETADDENGTIAEAIENYRKWAEKVDETSNSIEELNSTLRQLELDKFNNIADDYTKLLDTITLSTDKLNALIDTQEKIDGTTSKRFYEELITQTNLQLDYLQKKRDALEQQMRSAISNGIRIGSDEWREMESALDNVDKEIIQCTGSIEDFNDAIRDIDLAKYDKTNDAFQDIHDEIQNLLDLSEHDKVLDDSGSFTQSAITQMGALGQKYVLAKRQQEEAKRSLQELEEAHKKGAVNEEEYRELRRKYNADLNESVQLQKDIKDSVFEFKKQAVDKEIESINEARDAYQKYIETKKEALDKEQNSHDFQKDVNDKRQDLTSLDNQINQLTGKDDDTLARREELIQERKEKQEELDELLYRHSIDLQKETLDQEYENYSESCDNKIAKAEESVAAITENIELAFSEMMTLISEQADTYLDGLNTLCSEYGLNVSANLTTPWQNGENALGIYNGVMLYHTGSFNSMLDGVKQHIYNDGIEADITADKLVNTFGVSAQPLRTELDHIWDGLKNDIERSSALSSSVWGLFNNQNSTPLITQFNNVASSIEQVSDKLKEATDRMRDASNAYNDTSNADKTNSPIFRLAHYRDGTSIKLESRDIINARREAASYNDDYYHLQQYVDGHWIGIYQKGGLVTPSKEHPLLKKLANSVGEDTMAAVKYGERILTPQQNAAFEKLVSLASERFHFEPDIPLHGPLLNLPVPESNMVQTLNITSPLVNIQGNVGDAEIRKMEKVVDKKLKEMLYKQTAALRTYMGVK